MTKEPEAAKPDIAKIPHAREPADPQGRTEQREWQLNDNPCPSANYLIRAFLHFLTRIINCYIHMKCGIHAARPRGSAGSLAMLLAMPGLADH